MSKSDNQVTGVCRLTGTYGRFVRAHLIPRALTKPRPNGEPFAQFGDRQRPTRRRDSWYDSGLVTQAGEDILTGYDTWAISELRRLKLVWQAWGPMQALRTPDFSAFPDTDWGIRQIKFSDPFRMRLFFLSLLWRAAATTRAEFKEIDLRHSNLRRLRQYVREGLTPPHSFFPTILTQLSTVGFMHNLAPIAQTKQSMVVMGVKTDNEPIFRFYFDGLIIHFYRSPTAATMSGIEPMLVGQIAGTKLSTVTFAASWQLLNMRNCVADAEHEFPGAIARAEGK